MRLLLGSVVVLAASALLAGSARPARSPTVAACAAKDARLPGRANRALNVLDCLTPKSIVVNGTLTWSDCASAPPGDTCDAGAIKVSFHSTASGFALGPGLFSPEPWGGWAVGVSKNGTKTVGPYWTAWGLPGVGSFYCEAKQLDRASGTSILNYKRTVPLHDQGVGFALAGGAVRVSSSLYPGYHTTYGHNADRLFTPDTCQLPTLRPSFEAARTSWPAKVVPVGSLLGAAPVAVVSGSQKVTIPSPNGSWFGPKIVLAYRWSATLALRPSALSRSGTTRQIGGRAPVELAPAADSSSTTAPSCSRAAVIASSRSASSVARSARRPRPRPGFSSTRRSGERPS